jgi:hypothetical protein
MHTIIIPLGVIVDTDVMLTIKAFQDLCDNLKLGVRVQTKETLGALNPLFDKFKAGPLSEKEFETELLAAVDALIPAAHKLSLDPSWQTTWKESWKTCWNAMCIVDARALDVAKLISRSTAIEFHIYSETNQTHLAHITKHFSDYKVIFKNLHTTFEHNNSIGELLTHVLTLCTDAIEAKECALVLGDFSKVKDPFFQDLALKKREVITAIAKENSLIIFEVTSKHVDTMQLIGFVNQFQSNLKPTPALAVIS